MIHQSLTAQEFFKTHPRRDEVSASDKIELLQLDTRGKQTEQQVMQHLRTHRKRLEEEMDSTELLPHLLKHHVLTEEEEAGLVGGMEGTGRRQERNRALLEVMECKPPFWVVKFAECLRESAKHKHLSQLLLPPPGECT